MLSDATQGFQLIRKLGDGSFGLVQLCRDLQLDRYVAIKTLISGNSELTLQQQQQLLQHEARRMDRLKHSRVAVVYQFLMWQGRPAFVMEYLAGGTLREHVCGGNRGEAEAVRLMRQVAEGLCHVHRQSEVHLDLSPNNILLTDSGDAKISDFALPLPGVQGGTGGYKAPERYQGCADARSDVYSFGGCLYFAITGQHPPARQTLPDFSAGRFVKRVVLRCMQPDPRERYRDGGELVAALSEAAPALPAVARPGPPHVKLNRRGLLTSLEWTDPAAADENLDHLTDYPQLLALGLPPGVSQCIHLRTLKLTARGFTNKAIHHLSMLSQLEELDVSYSSIDDEGLEQLSRIRPPVRLQTLFLEGCAVTDRGLNWLAGLPLRWLHLGHTRITDDGLECLLSLPELQEVQGLNSTSVTAEARQRLCRQIPHLRCA